jgi:hypothetical protein
MCRSSRKNVSLTYFDFNAAFLRSLTEKILAGPLSLLVHQDRLDSGASPFLPFAVQKTTAFKPTCAGAHFRFLLLPRVDVQKEPNIIDCSCREKELVNVIDRLRLTEKIRKAKREGSQRAYFGLCSRGILR